MRQTAKATILFSAQRTTLTISRAVPTIKKEEKITLVPSGEGNQIESLIVSLGHELGHINDPRTKTDKTMRKDDDNFSARQAEREEAAWDWCEKFLSKHSSWDACLKPIFTGAKVFATKQYAAKHARLD